MYYDVLSKRMGQDAKGNDREFSEKYLVENALLCAEAEQKVLEYWNGENDVVSVKQSKIREFVNERLNDEQSIFLAILEDTFVNDDGSEKTTKYEVGLFSESIEEATKIMVEYMKQGLSNLKIIAIKKTKIIDLLKTK